MKLLLVGDVHAVPEELDDCQALMDLVRTVAKRENATVLLLGDQHHTHNVIRAEVMDFWFRQFSDKDVKYIALVGNHDYSGEGQTIHSMTAYRDKIKVIDKPTWIDDLETVMCMPYYSNREQFVKDCNNHNAKTLICHQTFDGAKYENGFYAPDGVDAKLLKFETVISGHIHTPMSFQVPGGPEVTYVGAPRWRSLSDANIDRAIWLYNFDITGAVISKKSYDTGKSCKQIKTATDTEFFPLELPLPEGIDWRVEIKGSAAWIERRKKELAGPGIKIRTVRTGVTETVVRESEGIPKAFRSYLEKYVPKHGTDRKTLENMSAERLHV